VRVGVALRTDLDHTDDADAVLVAQVVGTGGLQHLVTDDDLGDAGRIEQVEEGDTAVVAAAGDPSGEGDGLAGVLGTQGAGFMGTEHVSGGPCPGRACWYRDPGGTGAPPGGQPVQVWAGASSRCHRTSVAASPDHREVHPITELA